jgi:hypothetical protein
MGVAVIALAATSYLVYEHLSLREKQELEE